MTMPPFEEALAPDPGEEPDDLARRVSAGAGWTAGANLAAQAAQLASTIVLVRLLHPDDYGLATVVWFITGFAALFSDLGISAALVHKRGLTEENLAAGFWANLVAGVSLTMLVAALAPVIALIYGEPQLTGLIIIASLAFTLNETVVPAALLERGFRFRTLALIEAVCRMTGWAAAIGFAYAGFGAKSLVLGPMVTFGLFTIGCFAAVRWRPRGFGSKDSYRFLWRYGRGVTGFTITEFFSHQSDSLLVPLVAPPSDVGIYNRSYNLMTLPVNQISVALARVLLPALSSMQDDRERFRRGVRRSVLMVCAVGFPMAMGLQSTARDLIPVLFGKEWLGAIFLVQVLALASLPQIAEMALRSIYTATGETQKLFRFGVVQCGLSVGAVLIGLPWGVKGVAIAILVRQWAALPISLGWPLKVIDQPMGEVLRLLAGPAAAAAGMAAWVYGFAALTGSLSQPLRLALECATGGIVYVALLWFLSPQSFEEILGFVKRRRQG